MWISNLSQIVSSVCVQHCCGCVFVVGQGICARLWRHACFAHAHACVPAGDYIKKLCVIKPFWCATKAWVWFLMFDPPPTSVFHPLYFHVYHPSLPSCRPVRREIWWQQLRFGGGGRSRWVLRVASEWLSCTTGGQTHKVSTNFLNKLRL